MITGNPNRFAIEIAVDVPQDAWLFGKVRYLVSGEQVGGWSDQCNLNSAVGGFLELVKYKGKRYNNELFQAGAYDAFNEINRRLYIDFGQSDKQVRDDWKYFRRFIAKPSGIDVFDDWKCFIVENEQQGKLLWKHLTHEGNSPISECILLAGEFDSVLIAFIESIKTQFPGHINPTSVVRRSKY